MKVLWFSLNPTGYNPNSSSFNGGGWGASLENIVKINEDIDLGVAFLHPTKIKGDFIDGVSYYTFQENRKSLFTKSHNSDEYLISQFKDIINDFNPDLIHVFGCETILGNVSLSTNIPVVTHIQALVSGYESYRLPPYISTKDFIFSKGLPIRYRLFGILTDHAYKKKVAREINSIKHTPFFMGRTDWDKRIVSLINPNAKYFHCEEALRESFIKNSEQWHFKEDQSPKVIVTTISAQWYKGIDTILQTAKILKLYTDLDFEWKVFGRVNHHFFENKFKIKGPDYNVHFKGLISGEKLAEELMNASCYVHPSYIENSPNSVCEAQILGVPVIATGNGGITSLIHHDIDGRIFPANDPYILASHIYEICTSKDTAERLSSKAHETAVNRHDPEKIGERIYEIYTEILEHF